MGLSRTVKRDNSEIVYVFNDIKFTSDLIQFPS